MILIKNAHLFTMTEKPIEGGAVAFDDKIRYVGASEDAPNLDYDSIIDASGLVVMPGLIDAHCHVGMFEDGLGFEGDDGNEDSDPIMPQLRAIDGINPFDRAFSDARLAGITAVVTGPGSADPIGGQFAALKTSGICVDDMIIKAPCAMKMALGENPKSVFSEKESAPLTRMGTMALIRENLIKAREYMERLKSYEDDPDECDKPDFDMKLNALIPLLKREIPAKIHCHRADDICSAIRIGREFNIRVTLEHCTEGVMVADIIKREGLPVMLGPTLTDRSKPELKNMDWSVYKVLSDMGIPTAIITDHPEVTIDRLPLCVQLAVKNGMDEYKALEAVTSTAADNCGISDRVGRLKTGLDADIAVFSQLPSRFEHEVRMVFSNGHRVV